MKLRMLAGAAAVAALIATPAMAQTQQQFAGPQKQAVDSTGAKKVKKQQSRVGESRAMTRDQAMTTEQRRSGFPPADFAAAGVVGGAIGTAGAIATAPFRPFTGDSYAYSRDTSTMPNRGYIADVNGPKCLPGQVINLNGQQMRCQ